MYLFFLFMPSSPYFCSNCFFFVLGPCVEHFFPLSNLLLVFQYLVFFFSLFLVGVPHFFFFLSLELSSLLSVVFSFGRGSTVVFCCFFFGGGCFLLTHTKKCLFVRKDFFLFGWHVFPHTFSFTSFLLFFFSLLFLLFICIWSIAHRCARALLSCTTSHSVPLPFFRCCRVVMPRSSSTVVDSNQVRYASLQNLGCHRHQIVHVTYCTAWQTTKISQVYKNIIYIFILRRQRLCVVGIQSKRVRTYLSSLIYLSWPFCEVVRRPENTYEELTGLFEWPVGLSPSLERPADPFPSFELPLDLCLQSKFIDLILSFQVPWGSMNILFASRIFLFVAGYQNLHTFVFFPGKLLILSVNGNVGHFIHRQ